MGQPFVQPPATEPEPRLVWCSDCQGWWWSDTGHQCGDPFMDRDALIVGLVITALIVLIVLLAAGVIHWSPWRHA